MTGGGIKALNTERETVTFGLTLHCDITLSNNLEVNWPGHKWHLAKPITSASCDNIQMDPEPPASPIDTFEGEGYGRLDGVGELVRRVPVRGSRRAAEATTRSRSRSTSPAA